VVGLPRCTGWGRGSLLCLSGAEVRAGVGGRRTVLWLRQGSQAPDGADCWRPDVAGHPARTMNGHPHLQNPDSSWPARTNPHKHNDRNAAVFAPPSRTPPLEVLCLFGVVVDRCLSASSRPYKPRFTPRVGGAVGVVGPAEAGHGTGALLPDQVWPGPAAARPRAPTPHLGAWAEL